MCGDPQAHDHGDALSRRQFLARMGALAGAGALASMTGGMLLPRATAATRPLTMPSGLTGYRAAMHLHGSFSEGTASWAQHFSEATRNSVDILIPTDHDWRVQQRGYGGAYHFADWVQPTASGHYDLRPAAATGLAAGAGGTLTTVAAPADSTPGAGSLRMLVTPSGNSHARLSYVLDSGPSDHDLLGSVLGRAGHLWLQLNSSSTPTAYLGLQLSLSRDPVHGDKTITYRARTDITSSRAPVVTGSTAFVDVAVTQGQWCEVVTDLPADVLTAWPDTGSGDCGIHTITLIGIATKRQTVDGLMALLEWVPDPSYDPGSALSSVLDPLRAAHPSLLAPHGLEYSVGQHLGQIGGAEFFYPYPAGSSAHSDLPPAVSEDQVAQIKVHGGVASFNHPFGTGMSTGAGSDRTAKLTAKMKQLLANRLYGADALEVGYVARGMDLTGHLEVWDCLSANGLMRTGVGVSDDHGGTPWEFQRNRFVTIPLMTALDEASLTAALRVGRAAVGLLGDFQGVLDLSLNRVAFQGSAYVAEPDRADVVVVDGLSLPTDSVVHLVGGPVDFGGVNFARPSLVATIPASALAAGPVQVPATGNGDRYYRAMVLDTAGRVLAFTNPVWVVPGGASWVPPGRVAGG